jgi:hypothetical protein
VCRFRTAGTTRAVAIHGTTAYLFTGSRGIVVVDVSDLANPVAIGALGDLGTITAGAVNGAGDALAVASDRGLLFLEASTPGTLSLRSTLTFADDREVRAIQARSDSFLVASERVSPTRRLFLNLYRLPAGAVEPDSLREVSVALQSPSDLVWSGDLAFLATGNSGVTVIHVGTGATRTVTAGGRFVRDLDVNDSLVVATLSAAGLGKLRRAGASGDSLLSFTSENLQLEPTRVSLVGNRVVVSTQDVLAAVDPDEIARSAIELRDLDAPGPVATLGGTGRTRRVVHDAGYAYVADYTGGLRIYRAQDSDTSLVGVLPAPPFGRIVDVALDPPRRRAYLAAMAGGLEVVDISDPSAPALLATLLLADQVSAVAVIDSTLIVAGRHGISSPGVTFVDVSIPTSPALRGQVGSPFIRDPRAIAVRDTIAFVADAQIGLVSVGFRDPDFPGTVGAPSGNPARDLHLSGNLLLVGTRDQGLQVVDVFQPAIPALRSTVFTPPIFGVGRSGNSAVVFLAEEQGLVIDLSDVFAPLVRGPIEIPGSARDGAWVGDTLLVAAGFSLERYRVSPAVEAVPVLVIQPGSDPTRPEARISWVNVTPPGSGPALVGWNLYRDAIVTPPSGGDPSGTLVNTALLPPGTTQIVDPSVPGGVPLRYRLEGFFSDGSARKLAEGSYFVTVAPGVGRAYPNPYGSGAGVVSVPFTTSGAAGSIEAAVHDTQGRLVRRIAVAASGGFGTVIWDGRDGSGHPVPSGIYFIRIRGPGIDEASRVVVAR